MAKAADRPRVLRKDRVGANPLTVGAVSLVVIVVACWFAFRPDNPLSSPFRMSAVFQTSNGVRPNMPVRIAGIDVGKVTGVSAQKGTQATVITMEIDPEGLPVHKDAELKIRPRIFLEGNYFIDLRPGTPGQPALNSDDTIPVTQTATPVQLSQILDVLQEDTRENARDLLQGLGQGLAATPTREEDRGQDPEVRGLSGAQALNKSLIDAPEATRDTAAVTAAIVGDGGDVAATIKGIDRLSTALASDTGALQRSVVSFNSTVAALADQRTALGAAVAELPRTLQAANASFSALNAAFPPTRALARELLPGVRQTQATIDAARPWLVQAQALFSDDELGGLADVLAPTTRDLAGAGPGTQGLLEQQDLLAQCATKVFLPTGNIVIEDGPRTSGAQVYKEFFYALVGFNGESGNFDGNGPYIRASAGGGSNRIETGPTPLNGAKLYGNALLPPKGTRPAMPGKLPTQRFTQACKDQAVPDLSAAATGPADGQNGKAGNLLGYGPETAKTYPKADVRSVARATPPAAPARPDVQRSDMKAPREPGSVAGGLLGVLNPLRGEGASR